MDFASEFDCHRSTPRLDSRAKLAAPMPVKQGHGLNSFLADQFETAECNQSVPRGGQFRDQIIRPISAAQERKRFAIPGCNVSLECFAERHVVSADKQSA